MTVFAALWLPVLLSAVFVFVASSLIHMFTSWHKGEYKKVPGEETLMNALRPLAIPPGDYMVPMCENQKDMKTPEFQDKLKKGPVLMMTVMPNGPFAMGKPLVQWFVYSLVVGVFAAYVTSRALPIGASYLEVFRFAGVTAFACYAMALWQAHIWYHRGLRSTITSTLDGLLYACLTAGVFGWLWPQ